MRYIYLTFLSLFIFSSISYGQNTVTDTHPTAAIFVIDYQSGQEVAATDDQAILFKDAFIDLVINTNTARQQRIVPGHKTFVVTQLNPQTDGNGYQLSYQSKFLNQTITIYSFRFNIDQNTLYAFSQRDQTWEPELVQGNNVVNLNNCLALSKFNYPDNGQSQQADANNQQADNTPLDTQVSAAVTPPALPEYEQPECPQDGYLWQPGYWAYSVDSNGYYWVPGVWVAPPNPGLLWTPPYWGYDGGFYVFHHGYWGNNIGFYGGINYGYGYGGSGYYGGEWREGRFRYNTAVVRVNVTVVHNTYVNTTVINRTVVNNHVSFNGGRGGIVARPNANEQVAMREHHVDATPDQIRNQRIAREDKSQFASANGGRPTNLAAEKAPVRDPHANQNSTFNHNVNSNGNRPGFGGNNNNNQPNNTNGNRTGFGGNNGTNNNNNQPSTTNGNRTGFGGNNNNQPNTTNGNKPGFGGNNGTNNNNNQPNTTNGNRPGFGGNNGTNNNNNNQPNTTNGNRPGFGGGNQNQPNATGLRPGSNGSTGTNPNQPNNNGVRPGTPANNNNKPKPTVVKPVRQQPQPQKKSE